MQMKFMGGMQSDVSDCDIHRFEDALFSRNSQKLQIVMRDFLLQTASAFDVSYEAFYQGMMLGLCAVMYENYWLSGNRESGDGRYDIQLKPKQREWPGILIELKVYRGKKQGLNCKKNWINYQSRPYCRWSPTHMKQN